MTGLADCAAPMNTAEYQSISLRADLAHLAYRRVRAHGKAWGATSSRRLVPQAFRWRRVTSPSALHHRETRELDGY
jgi:hypothetical protein